MNRIVAAIKRLRQAGLSQSEIGRLTGIPQPRISRWEAGEAPASARDAIRLIDLADSLEAAQRSAAQAP